MLNLEQLDCQEEGCSINSGVVDVHPDTTSSKRNLVLVLEETGKSTEARAVFAEAAPSSGAWCLGPINPQLVLGPSQPSTRSESCTSRDAMRVE